MQQIIEKLLAARSEIDQALAEAVKATTDETEKRSLIERIERAQASVPEWR